MLCSINDRLIHLPPPQPYRMRGVWKEAQLYLDRVRQRIPYWEINIPADAGREAAQVRAQLESVDQQVAQESTAHQAARV